ncbi:glycosyltransferase 87 family protein [Tomitella biformata]|uniref:glycosyltransferase 87 family protein n=1 Tax=Tomitella biformata TaxID=630403 RepID=UPI00046367AC|nr:glycosyltransferase 87 family protein [Tomitella biformata]
MTKPRMMCRILTWPVFIVGLATGLLNALYWTSRQQPDDWSSLWIAGLLVRQGKTGHLYDHDPVDFAAWAGPAWDELVTAGTASAAPHPFVHIPGVAYAVAPLTDLLSFDSSAIVLTVVSGFCLPVLISASWVLWSRQSIPFTFLVIATIAGWYSNAFQSASWLGQTTPIIVCITICAVACASYRPITGGILLGIVGAVKLTPLGLIPLMLFFPRYRRSGIIATITAGAAALASLILGGRELFSTWLATLSRVSSSVVVTSANRSFAAMVLQDTPPDGSVAPVVTDAPTIVTMAPVLVACLLFVCLAAAAWHNRAVAAPAVLVGAYAIATAASGILWSHYMLVCIPLVIGIIVLAQRLPAPARAVVTVFCAAAALFLYSPLNESVGTPGYLAGLALPWGDLAALVTLIIILIAVVAATATPGVARSFSKPSKDVDNTAGRHAAGG